MRGTTLVYHFYAKGYDRLLKILKLLRFIFEMILTASFCTGKKPEKLELPK